MVFLEFSKNIFILLEVCLVVISEQLKNETLTKTSTDFKSEIVKEKYFDEFISIKSRFSFNVSHREILDPYNSAYFHWMKSLRKGLYIETKDISEGFESKPHFYKLQRNDAYVWKLRNITDTISEDKLKRVRGENDDLEAFFGEDDQNFKLKILPDNSFRVVKIHPKNRNRIRILNAQFDKDYPFLDFIFVSDFEDILTFCALHDSVNSSLFMASGIKRETKSYQFALSLENVLCINPKKNFPDTWISSTMDIGLVDVHPSLSSRGVLFASQFREPLSLEEVRMLHVEHLKTVISFDYGKTWSPLRLQNGCSMGENEPSVYLDQSFSQFFFDKHYLGITERPEVTGVILATGHLVFDGDENPYPGVFLSQDGGIKWTRIFNDRLLLKMSKNGYIIFAVRQCLDGPTKDFYVSYDIGQSWIRYQIFEQEVCVHEIEEGPLDVFVALSSVKDQQLWIMSVIDFETTVSSMRKCNRKDVHYWPTNSEAKFCVHGHKILNFRRNINKHCDLKSFAPKSMHFNCSCTIEDFRCAKEECNTQSIITDFREKVSKISQKYTFQNITKELGLYKKHKNTCFVAGESFQKIDLQDKKCSKKIRKSSSYENAKLKYYSNFTLILILILALAWLRFLF